VVSPTPRLVLASKSFSRRQILENAGIPFNWVDADVDENAIKQQGLSGHLSPEDIALSLAHAKAERVFDDNADTLVLGCDQILVSDGDIYYKPADIAEARSHLMRFRGRPHTLISAMTLLQSNAKPWRYVDRATLTVRDISDAFLDDYLKSEGDSILSSVGAYRLESRGIQLFDDIVGNYFTILGLPLLPLLNEVRRRGGLET